MVPVLYTLTNYDARTRAINSNMKIELSRKVED